MEQLGPDRKWSNQFQEIYHRLPTEQEFMAAKAKGFPSLIAESEEPQENGYYLFKGLIIILLAIFGYIVGFLFA